MCKRWIFMVKYKINKRMFIVGQFLRLTKESRRGKKKYLLFPCHQHLTVVHIDTERKHLK